MLYTLRCVIFIGIIISSNTDLTYRLKCWLYKYISISPLFAKQTLHAFFIPVHTGRQPNRPVSA